MKTIKEKADDYLKRVNNFDINLAYIEGAYESLLTLMDRLRSKYEFNKFTLEDVGRIIHEMRTGEIKI